MGGWTPVVEPTPSAWTPVDEPQAPSTYSKLTSGYNQNAEDFAQNHPLIGPVVRFLDAAGGAAMATPEGVYDALRHPSDTAKAALSSIAAWKDPAVRKGALSVLPEALGQGVGNVAAGEAMAPAASAVAKAVPSAADVGTALRTESGALKPGVQVASKGAGAAAGGMLGGGWGALVGEHLGTNLADWLIPDRPKGAPPIKNTPFEAPAPVAELTKPVGPTPPPRKLTLSSGEDLGLGMGNEHTINNAQGERIGSAQIEPKDDGTLHVHWLGGDFSNYGRGDVMRAIKDAYPDAGKITYDRRRLAKGADAATTTPRQMAVAQAPSVDDVVNQATGNKPLQPNVRLREQSAPAPAVEAPKVTEQEQDPIKLKYPDPAVRQMVRANGENVVQAIGGDKDTMQAVHNLTRVDLRQALINSGEDMGQQTVSNSKTAGEGSITRENAFNKLLAKGHSPSDIVRLAKQVPQ